jgi:hypothetical protein
MGFTQEQWDAGVSWEEYLAGVEKHAELWHHHWENAEVGEGYRARLADLPAPRRVLVLSEDWCGDAVRSVPVIVKALKSAPNVEVRILDITSRPEVIDRHLTKGAKAIPVAIVADPNGDEIGWWGPRPAPLQTMLRDRVREKGRPTKETMGSFYAPIMGWYKKDGGRTTLDELLLLLERG